MRQRDRNLGQSRSFFKNRRLRASFVGAISTVVDRVAVVAAARSVPRAQVALVWLLSKRVITAPITKLQHLDDALASVNVKLSADEITSLEETVHSPRRRRLRLGVASSANRS